MQILYAPKFARQYKKLPAKLQEVAERRENIFRKNPFDARLKTHKLSGHLEGFYAFSIDFAYRIIFDFTDENTVRFYEIGTHEIYE